MSKLFVAALSLALAASPALAQTHAVPLPTARPAAAAAATTATAGTAAAAPAGKLTAAQVTANPFALLQSFTASDLQEALIDAQGQTPPDTTSANCYAALLPIVQGNVANPFPTGLGAFQALQKARDARAMLANLKSNNGPLAALNIACAPLVLDVQNTLVMLGIGVGIVANPIGGAAVLGGGAGIAGVAGIPAAIAAFLGLPKL